MVFLLSHLFVPRERFFWILREIAFNGKPPLIFVTDLFIIIIELRVARRLRTSSVSRHPLSSLTTSFETLNFTLNPSRYSLSICLISSKIHQTQLRTTRKQTLYIFFFDLSSRKYRIPSFSPQVIDHPRLTSQLRPLPHTETHQPIQLDRNRRGPISPSFPY